MNEKFNNISKQVNEELNQLLEISLINKEKLDKINLLEERKSFDNEIYDWKIS